MSLVILDNFWFACGDDSLTIFFTYAIPISVITGVYLSVQILDAAAVATTFAQADTATVESAGLNARNLSGNLIFIHI